MQLLIAESVKKLGQTRWNKKGGRISTRDPSQAANNVVRRPPPPLIYQHAPRRKRQLPFRACCLIMPRLFPRGSLAENIRRNEVSGRRPRWKKNLPRYLIMRSGTVTRPRSDPSNTSRVFEIIKRGEGARARLASTAVSGGRGGGYNERLKTNLKANGPPPPPPFDRVE